MKTKRQPPIQDFENLLRSFGRMAIALTEARNALTVIAEGCERPDHEARRAFKAIADKLER